MLYQIAIDAWRRVLVPALCLSGSFLAAGDLDVPPHEPHLTDAQRAEIRLRLNESIRRLEEQDASTHPTGVTSSFQWPLRIGPGLNDFGYYRINRFVDHDAGFPDQLLDYNCGQRTYDTAGGYNHQGTDLSLWSYPWYRMEFDHVEVVAAAPGRIVLKDDGNPNVCGSDGSGWNAVYIRHADHTVAWYGHLKPGSTTSTPVGQFVEQGEYLGAIGISGNSGYPHLHLEVYDSEGSLADPFSGPCNPLPSWWASQPDYYDSAINDITTGRMLADEPGCPDPEDPHEETHFDFGEDIYFRVFYRDVLDTQQSQFTIYRSDDTVADSWIYTTVEPYQSGHGPHWYRSFSSGPVGTWRFEAVYNGQTYERLFNVGLPPLAGSTSDLTLAKARGADIELLWEASCLFSDLDYSVYEGSLGDFASHLPRFCSTGGMTKKTLTPPLVDAYYLVVPTNNEREGSYGADGDGLERLPSDASCRIQLLGDCP